MLKYSDLHSFDRQSLNRRLHNSFVYINGLIYQMGKFLTKTDGYFYEIKSGRQLFNNSELRATEFDDVVIYPDQLGWLYRRDGTPFLLEQIQYKTYWWGINSTTHRIQTIESIGWLQTRPVNHLFADEMLAAFVIKPAKGMHLNGKSFRGPIRTDSTVDDYIKVREACEAFYGGFTKSTKYTILQTDDIIFDDFLEEDEEEEID